jgi:hypothetical protein
MPCKGNREDHCCHLKGTRCPFLEENVMIGRRWACGLYLKLQDWNKVIMSDEYKKTVAPIFEPLGMNCRDWPDGTGANAYECECK